MKIAVVGGNGFIGKEFVRYAEENGHSTAVIGSDCNAFTEEGENRAKSILKGCDAMVFLAAKRPTADFSVKDVIYNINLAEKYFRLCDEATVKNVVTASSTAVYSDLRLLPWLEDTFQAPLSLYGASKQAVDSIALLYNRQYDMKIKSLRLAQVIGIGERKGYLLNTLIDHAIAGKKQTIYGKGIGKRQYIYVKDVCDAMLHSVVSEKETSGIFNIGMPHNVTVIELAETINRMFHNTAGIELLADKPEDTKEYLMDTTKATTVLHWTACYNLESTFADIKDGLQ